MLLYTSYMADGGHGTRDYPALLVGKAGGTLAAGPPGRLHKGTSVGNLYVAMLDRMGAKVDTFGTGTAPLADLA